MKFNLNTLLLIIAGLGALGPDLANASVWLSSLGILWLVPIAHIIGVLAAAFAGLAHALPRLRPLLSTLGLATSPGEIVPLQKQDTAASK
jgi:hypothetical protein